MREKYLRQMELFSEFVSLIHIKFLSDFHVSENESSFRYLL